MSCLATMPTQAGIQSIGRASNPAFAGGTSS